MKIKVYEDIYMVTETTQNGNERRFKKSVLSPIFKDGKHVIKLDRGEKGKQALEKEHYYNIEYIDTKVKTLIVTEDFTV